ncbi:hypothetical protein TWF481_001319 [Arthrobotrys musiformis]|uniref:F-box domain-containing protein n=1 Tax=Arthrobotrys musiformis TaxID=47236 RepID=A0AAV9WR33_9PEZI
MDNAHIAKAPLEVTYLFIDRLEKEDLCALRLTCRYFNDCVVQSLYKRLVVKPEHSLTDLKNLGDKIGQYVKTIEFFPETSSELQKPGDDVEFKPIPYLETPNFQQLSGLHLHGHEPGMRDLTVKILERQSIKELTLNFKQIYFLPSHCGTGLEMQKSLEKLSIRLGRKKQHWLASRDDEWNYDAVVPVWDMITANSSTLKTLNLEFPFQFFHSVGGIHVQPSHEPDTSDLFLTGSEPWKNQLQLQDLKLQHLEKFGEVYAKTKFFNPETLRSLSLVDCPNSDSVLLELAGSMRNLKALQLRGSIKDPKTIYSLLLRLPALETLHIALPFDLEFDYKWLNSQKHSVKNLWIEALDSKEKDNDNFEDWKNLEELAFTKFHATTGRRSGALCLKTLKIPASTRIVRLLHPPGGTHRYFDWGQATKVIEFLGFRQFRMMSAEYPKTPEGRRKRMYIKPNLQILAFGSWHDSTSIHDRTKVLKVGFEHTERLGKFKCAFKRIPMGEFARGHPDTTILAYGEARGPGAWLGHPFTDEMTFSDDADGEEL